MHQLLAMKNSQTQTSFDHHRKESNTAYRYNGIDSFSTFAVRTSLTYLRVQFKFSTNNLDQTDALLLYMGNDEPPKLHPTTFTNDTTTRRLLSSSLASSSTTSAHVDVLIDDQLADFVAVTLHQRTIVAQINLGHGMFSRLSLVVALVSLASLAKRFTNSVRVEHHFQSSLFGYSRSRFIIDCLHIKRYKWWQCTLTVSHTNEPSIWSDT